jgi:hypothetical protein
LSPGKSNRMFIYVSMQQTTKQSHDLDREETLLSAR